MSEVLLEKPEGLIPTHFKDCIEYNGKYLQIKLYKKDSDYWLQTIRGVVKEDTPSSVSYHNLGPRKPSYLEFAHDGIDYQPVIVDLEFPPIEGLKSKKES